MSHIGIKSSHAYRPDIDGLRALAVTSVVLFHAGVQILSGGFVGVDVFFVLSGYLITGHIYSEVSAGSFTYKSFYVRRFKRILPALLVVLLASTVVATLILSPAEFIQYSVSATSAVFGASNLYYWWSTNYFSPSADHLPMLMTWSLAVEEQFYVFFPILLLILFRYARQHILLAVTFISTASLLLAIISIRFYPSLTFYMLPMRAWELGAGAILAIAEARGFSLERLGRGRREALAAAGIAMIVVPVALYSNSTIFPGEAAIPPVLGTVLVIATRQAIVNRALGLSPFVFVGLISYSWYLWHWPLLAFQRVASPDGVSQSHLLLNVGLSFLLAVASYYAIERPFRRTTLNGSQVLRSYGVAAIVVAAIVLTPALMQGLPWRVDASINAMEASISEREPCLVPYGVDEPTISKKCTPSTGTDAIALIGDSHAAALAPGLRKVAERAGIGVLVMTKSSCPPMVTVTRFMPNHPSHDQECAAFNRAVFEYLRSRSDVRTIVLAGYWAAPLIEADVGSRYVDAIRPNPVAPSSSNPTVLRQGLTDEVRRMSALGRNVVLLQDAPLFDKNPVSIALRDALPARSLLAGFSGPTSIGSRLPTSALHHSELESTRAVVDEIARSDKEAVTLLDPYGSLCQRELCSFRLGDDVLYVDNQHLSLAGSAMLSTEILRSVRLGQADASKVAK